MPMFALRFNDHHKSMEADQMKFRLTNSTRFEITTEFNTRRNVFRVIMWAINGISRMQYKIVEHASLSDAVDYMMINYPEAKLAKIITENNV